MLFLLFRVPAQMRLLLPQQLPLPARVAAVDVEVAVVPVEVAVVAAVLQPRPRALSLQQHVCLCSLLMAHRL